MQRGMATAEEPGNATQELGDDVVDDDKPEYLSGLRLWLVLASVTLVAFVMLLDMSIIVTVFSFPPSMLLQSVPCPSDNRVPAARQYLKSPMTFTLSAMLAGMGAPFSWPSKCAKMATIIGALMSIPSC